MKRDLERATREYCAACEACPHWGYEFDGEGDLQECCYTMLEARDRVRRVRARERKAAA